MGMDLGEIMNQNEANPRTDELLEKLENEPHKADEVRGQFLEMLKPAIMVMKKAPNVDASREKQFYKDVRDSEDADELKKIIEEWADERGLR